MALKPDSDKDRAEQIAVRQQREQEVLMREVDEAVRKEEIGGVAKRYAWPIIIGFVVALAAFGGYLFWQDRSEGQKEDQSERLIAAFDELEQGRLPQADADLATLADEGSSAPALSAKFARAGIALNQNRRDEAAALYQSVADDADAPQPYRDLANIRAAAIGFEQADPQQIIDRLKPLATPGNPWFGSAGELVGMAYLKQGKPELAGPLFAAVAQDETVPASLRSRTRQLAGMLGFDAVADVEETLAEMNVQDQAAAE